MAKIFFFLVAGGSAGVLASNGILESSLDRLAESIFFLAFAIWMLAKAIKTGVELYHEGRKSVSRKGRKSKPVGTTGGTTASNG